MILNKKPKMIIFDVGGTLFDDGKFDAASGFEKLRVLASNPEVTNADELASLWTEYFKCITESGNSLEVPLSVLIKYVTMNTGLHLTVPIVEQEEIFDRFNSTRNVIEGVVELLSACDELGIRTAVISNNMMSGESLDISLKRWIPESKFEFCLSSADLLFKKPEKYLFESAMNYANVDPSDCVYCGDTFTPDIKGSIECGMNAVLLDRKSEIDSEIRKYGEKEYIAVNSWHSFIKFLLDLK